MNRINALHDEIAEIEARVARMEGALEHIDNFDRAWSLSTAIDQECSRLRELRQELYEEEDAAAMREKLSDQRWARARML
jgi:predicted  nucleic acid-binding Zn-ribbon protein